MFLHDIKNRQKSGPQIRWEPVCLPASQSLDDGSNSEIKTTCRHNTEHNCAIFTLLYNNNPQITKLEVIAL